MKRIVTAIVIVSCIVMLLNSCALLKQNEPGEQPSTIQDVPSEQEPVRAETKYRRITSEEARSMMSDDVTILDVRTQEEFDGGHIRNAVLLPYDEIKESAERVIEDNNRTVLVYCRTGRRSEIASRELIDMGFTEVFDFGGIVDWTGEIVMD